MKAKTKFLIFPIFLGLIFGMIFSINQVDAVSYYNWIRNPSFITYSNWCEDGGFESGEFESGLVYGNWSQEIGGSFKSDGNENSGIWCFQLTVGQKVKYNFTEAYEPFGADINNFTFYMKYTTTDSIKVYFYYVEGGSDSDSYTTSAGNGVYAQVVIDNLHDDSKTIDYFIIEKVTSGSVYLDDVILLVDDGGGQDSIVFGGNNDWQLGQTSSSYAPYFGHINTVLGRLDNTSVQMDSPSETYKIIQYIDFLDSDTIHFVNIYVLGANIADGEGIKIRFLYSDGSTSEKIKLATGDGSIWEELNFGKSWISSGKYITLIYVFPVFDGETGSSQIDDIGIWSSLPYGYSKFMFTISPYPIEKGSYDFDAYSETVYTFTGYFYNITDLSLSINGTYQLGDSFGLHTGTITNGLFSLQLNKRTYTGTPYTLETLSVTIITEDEIFNVDIRAYWYPVSGEVEIPDIDVDNNLILNFFMYGIFFLAIPLTVTVYVGGATNSSLGITTFVGVETLMGAIGLSIGLIDIWFMIVIIILDVLLIFTMIRNR